MIKARRVARARTGAIISNAVMWICAGTVHGAAEASPTVHQDAIYISLPVFIASIIATAGFTWLVAKYDNERLRKIERLENRLEKLTHEQCSGSSE